LANVIGITSIATTKPENVKIFKQYTTFKDKINNTWKLSKKLNHILMYDLDHLTFNDLKEIIKQYKGILLEKKIGIPDIYILQSSKDGYHLISPQILSFQLCNTLINHIPDNIEDKNIYPNLDSRTYDRFCTLRISPKYSYNYNIIKEKPKLKAFYPSKITFKTNVSLAHLNFFNLPILENYNLIKTLPILVKYRTKHRIK
jgi:hypothetical protein